MLEKLVLRLLAAALGCLSAEAALCQSPIPYLVADLAPGIGAVDTDPSPGVELNGRLVFFGRSTNGTTWVPFITDGTPGGTAQLLGPASTQRPLAARIGNFVIFGVDLSDGTGDVWSTDGTNAGTRRILQGYGVSAVPDRWHGGAWIVFGAKRGSRSYLYRTDGQVCEYAGSVAPSHLTAVRWQFGPVGRYVTFYAATTAATGREPWFVESGPGPFGTTVPALVQDLAPGVASGFAAPADSTGFATWVDPGSGELYVATVADQPSSGTEVRRLRRTFTTPFALLPPQEVAPGHADAAPRDLVARGSEVLFAASNAALGSEPWRLSFPTGVLTPFNLEAGPASSNPRGFVAMPSPNGAPLPDVWFQAEVTGPGRELWRYDGNTTSMLLDLNPLRNSSDPVVLGFADGQVFFAADNYLTGRELWRTDGTPGGTFLAFDAAPGPDSSDPTACGVIDVGGTQSLLYAAASPYGRELHRVDATTAAPQLVRNLTGQAESSNPRPILAWDSGPQAVRWADGRALLVGGGLWVTDGTPGNATQLLPGPLAAGNLATVRGGGIAFDDGTAMFVGQPLSLFSGVPMLWITDGTPAGTQLAGTVGSPAAFGYPPVAFGLFEFGSNVYVGRADSELTLSAGATSMWRTNRTGAAPQQVLGPAQGIAYLKDWCVVGDRIFLTGIRPDGSTGRELWVWQPPSAPTLVADLRPGSQGSNPRWLVPFRNRCYFVANDGVHGDELWASNGLAGGTFLVRDANPGAATGAYGPLVSVSTSLVYSGDDGVNGREPWRSTGVQAGTQMIADLRPGPAGSAPGAITAVHVGVFACTADDGMHGRELWRIDTVTGPTLFDLRPGPVGSGPSDLTWSTRHLFFAADDGVSGREPWYASWIDFQTVAMLADVAPGSGSSISQSPFQNVAVPAGQHVLFAADNGDGVTGRELYAIDATGASSPIGTSCVQPFQTMELRSTAPILGQGLTYWVFDPGTGVLATTLLSPKPSAPGGLSLPGIACPVWVDPNAYVVVDQFTTPGSFTRTIPVPSLPTVLGAVMRMQCVFDYPPMLATNGLELVFGN